MTIIILLLTLSLLGTLSATDINNTQDFHKKSIVQQEKVLDKNYSLNKEPPCTLENSYYKKNKNVENTSNQIHNNSIQLLNCSDTSTNNSKEIANNTTMNSSRINVKSMNIVHKITAIPSKSSVKKKNIQEYTHKPRNKIKHDNNVMKDNYLNLSLGKYNNDYVLNVSSNYISNINTNNIIIISSNEKENVSNIEYMDTSEYVNNKEIKHIIYERLISKPPSSN